MKNTEIKLTANQVVKESVKAQTPKPTAMAQIKKALSDSLKGVYLF